MKRCEKLRGSTTDIDITRDAEKHREGSGERLRILRARID